ncbi:amino acid ABC transporter substrate-binding protein, partial [Streptomyces olivaceus]|uniref:ABC transporter substrate-binding protein n=1 Tax=Streptomyces olivaceus TaxID=47716 RepID=UPI001D613084|nr:amino acid ABC transporter substrate-binding protein [Streptomyces olivaceus]MBZ6177405.1 amino acid ABC transporter substrate-binding protein [Streptomyces olivaceus]
EPAVPIVRAVRRDRRLAEILVGAPAGQPEFAEWAAALGEDGVGIPFLRYLPERLGPLGERVGKKFRERLGEAPSFVAFEGWDTVNVLAAVLRSHGTDRAAVAESWPRVAVEGTRGPIRFSRTPGISVWQWAWTPVQVVDRDPAEPDRFRILHAG